MIRKLFAHSATDPLTQAWHIEIQSVEAEKALELTYQIQGDIEQLEIPERQASPRRMDDLWVGTCCEIFLRGQNCHQRYLEFNFSPSGHWAFYRFSGYRKDQERPEVTERPIITPHIQQTEVALEVNIPWSMIKDHLPGALELDAGFSVILKQRTGSLSYWAAKHPAEKPDFHHPESFFAL